MQQIGDRYELREVLGEGASARVYQAFDTALKVPRAVKILSAPGTIFRQLRDRIRREAQVMASLDHPNVLRIYDVGVVDDHDFIVMELAEGKSLQHHVEEQGTLPVADAVRYMLQVLSALQAAHQADIVHRDVKPQNILLNADGRALLGDFGIALLHDAMRYTHTGASMGSLSYMAPEQRLDARNVGAAADIYAAGTTLYYLITGANPVDLFASPLHSPRWSDLPERLRPVIRRATRYGPDDRYSSAQAFADDLRRAQDQIGVPLPPGALIEDEDGDRPESFTDFMGPTSGLTMPRLPTDLPYAPTAQPATPTVMPTAIPDEAPRTPTGSPLFRPLPSPPSGQRPVKDDVEPWRALVATSLALVIGLGMWFLGDLQPPRAAPAPLNIEEPKYKVANPAPTDPPTVVEVQQRPQAPQRTSTPRPRRPERATLTPRSSRPALEQQNGKPAAGIAAGVWRGTMDGQSVTIRLIGSDRRLSGTISSIVDGHPDMRARLRGRYDAMSQRIFLRGISTRDWARPGNGEIELDQNGDFVGGIWRDEDTNRVRQLNLERQ
ncbi:MAG: protein kinase [Myxococcota bacterium]